MRILKRIYHLIVGSKITTLSGSLCFFLLLNGGSYLFLFVSISSYFFIDFEALVSIHLEDSIIKEILLYLLQHNSNLSASIVLLGSSIYSSSSLYYHFLHTCEILTRRAADERLGKRVQSLLLVPVVLIVIFLMIIMLSVVQVLLGAIAYLFIVVFFLLFIIFLNKLALRDYSIKRLYKGIFFSFIYWLVFSVIFIIYIHVFSNFKIVYGVLSFIIIFLFYLYIVAIGVLLGIYINCKNLEVSRLLFEE